MSVRPSPSMSASASRYALLTLQTCWAAKEGVAAFVGVVFSSTDTVFEELLAATRSSLPSPLRSASATARGWLPVANDWAAAKDAVEAFVAVVFSSTQALAPS